MNQRLNWQSYWRDALRSIKRALIARGQITVAGVSYRVAYEARHFREDKDASVIKTLVRDKRCIFDVGGHVGVMSLVMASGSPADATIHTFEASEASCLVLRENVLLNGLVDRIRVVNAMISDRSGQTLTYHWNFVSGNASSVIQYAGTQEILLTKASLSIDDYAAQTGARPDFVKVDVEGAEVGVLGGMQATLSQVRPLVIVEIHGWPERPLPQQVSLIMPILRDVDYRFHHLYLRKVVQTPEEATAGTQTGATYTRFWALLVPSGVEIPDLPAIHPVT